MQSLQRGQCYLIRTVTHYYTGRVVSVTLDDVLLEDAAWIPDTGRYSTALETGDLSEVEPYPGKGEVILSAMGIIDAAPWPHKLPRARR